MKYPNLELLAYVCLQKVKEIYRDALYEKCFLKEECYVFPQTWPNTGIGMDASGGVSGSMFTEAYTTVFCFTWCEQDNEGHLYHSSDEIYAVFFGDNLAYSFLNPNEKFFSDFKSHNMTSQREALEKYI